MDECQVPSKRNRRKRNVQQDIGPTHLDDFFASYPAFTFDSSKPVMGEFRRMCREYRWGGYNPEKDEAYDLFKDALTQQFNAIYGTDVDEIDAWRNLCRVLRISPIPEGLKACRQAVEETHVNLVDLVDTYGTGEPVVKFASEMRLSIYTKDTGKYFPKENAYAGGLLRHLLRHIMSPAAENDGTPRGGSGSGNQRRGRGGK
ncbi:hypothetical protein JAAARDRAFT_183348 [Jaapia argillacea MUCL 33604]|uniref:Uncharacterized protein n=1 Tax=Jaapia argillacea MUCL 33604 TaxID=933084 RepID=A0A067PST8_9AGAM|nr:hypothetical protein JAAARDRAFT_183348 [Jaapia argillacea MUCL 33604]